MRTIQLCLALCLVAVTTGCTSRPVTRVSNNFVDDINKRLGALQTSPPPNDAKQKRNEAIEYVVATFDANYEEFVRTLEAKRSRANFVADVVEISTSAAIGITKGSQRTIQIMGIALTGFRGGRKSADLNFFKEQTTAVLITKMDDSRAQVYAGMLAKMKDQDINEYPMTSAVRDLVAYYNAGTLVRAFTQLTKDTAVQARQSENKVLELKGVPITPEATEPYRNLSIAAREILTALENDLKSTDATKKAEATTRLQNIVAALERDKDAAAALKKSNVSSKDTDGVKLDAALVDIRRSATIVNNNGLVNTINQAIVDSKK
jgi:hypothetical protein